MNKRILVVEDQEDNRQIIPEVGCDARPRLCKHRDGLTNIYGRPMVVKSLYCARGVADR
jgi:hypothetical protein